MIVVFLVVTLNLNNGSFKPISKKIPIPTHVNIVSNNPRPLLKQTPNAVNQKINRLLSCKIIFEECKYMYDETLKNSGFQGRLVYVNPVNSGSNGRSNIGGTCRLVKRGETNNNQSNRRWKIEIEK